MYINSYILSFINNYKYYDFIPPIKPETAHPIWLSISNIFTTDDGSNKVDVTLFSTASNTPSAVRIPMAVEPNLTASIAYSTWNNLSPLK